MSIKAVADLKKNDVISFDIPSSVYGTFTPNNPVTNEKLYTLDNVFNNYINTTASTIQNTVSKISFRIVMDRNASKDSEIIIQLYGNNIFSYVGSESKQGVVAGYLEKA